MNDTSDDAQRQKTAVYVQALRLMQDGQVVLARSRAGVAASAHRTSVPTTSAEASERFAAALVAVITDLPGYRHEVPSNVQGAIGEAHRSGRLAWAAALRSAHACGLIAAACHGQALEEVVTAEAELAAERAMPGPLDPFGSPSALAAAANNLGAAYELLGLHALAEPHLLTALGISVDTYGPEIESQVSIDLFNLAAMELVWALELIAQGDAAAVDHATSAVAHARRLRRRAADDDHWPAFELAAACLELGGLSVVAPAAVTAEQADHAAAWCAPERELGPEITAVANLVSARVARLRGRAAQAARAADSIAALADPRNDVVLLLARYEAMAALDAPSGPADELVALALHDRLRLRDLLQTEVARRVRAAAAAAADRGR